MIPPLLASLLWLASLLFFSIYAVVAVFVVAGGDPAIDGVLAVAGVPGIFVGILLFDVTND